MIAKMLEGFKFDCCCLYTYFEHTFLYIYHTHQNQHIIHTITTININSHCHHDPMDFHSPKVTFISRITALFMRPLTIFMLLLLLLVALFVFFWFHWTKVLLSYLLFNKLQLFYVLGYETIYHVSAKCVCEHGKLVIQKPK